MSILQRIEESLIDYVLWSHVVRGGGGEELIYLFICWGGVEFCLFCR